MANTFHSLDVLDEFTITNSKKEKLLDTSFDDSLKFQYHIENFFKKPSLKLRALLHVAPFVDLPPKKIYSILFFSHSLATAIWFGCAIEEYSITK